MTKAGQTKSEPWGDTVTVEFDDGVAWVAMNRPEKRNAINPAMAFEMAATMDVLETDPRCRVFVLTGAGDSFAAGMDLKEYFRETDAQPEIVQARIFRTNAEWQWRRMLTYTKPTIAMVNGWCFGGALTPLISCDLAIAADEALLGVSEINWGIIPAGVVTKALSSVLNPRDALYYIMTGDNFSGSRAAEIGLVNYSVPKAKLKDETRKLAAKLKEKNPFVLRQAKQAYRSVRDMSWEQAFDYLMAKHEQTRSRDPEKGQAKGMSQFIDEKKYRPGLGAYTRDGD